MNNVSLQLTESDQELYKNFPLVVSDRWQQEVAETVFEAINQDADKTEQKRRQKPRSDDSVENCTSTACLISYVYRANFIHFIWCILF